VKALIEVRWDAIWWKIITFVILPYLIFLIVFSYYTANDLISEVTAREKDKITQMNVCSTIQIVCISYFLLLEVASFMGNFRAYLKNVWNYLQILLIVLIFYAEISLSINRS